MNCTADYIKGTVLTQRLRRYSKATYFPITRELRDYLGIDGDGENLDVLVECVEIDGRPSLILKRLDGEKSPDATPL